MQVDIVPNYGHDFGQNHTLLERAAAEFCAMRLDATERVHLNVRPLKLHYWIPAVAIWVGVVAGWWWRVGRTRLQPSKWMVVMAWVIGVVAALTTVLHIVVLQLPASGYVLRVARYVVIDPRFREDFDWLATQLRGAQATVGEILEHVRLADLQRSVFVPGLSEADFRQWILSPKLDGGAEPLKWRRFLWESFYPWVRKYATSFGAAEALVRHLRGRVTVVSGEDESLSESVVEIWRTQVATSAGFERIYVAALRSVGIPARIGPSGKAEILDNGIWAQAPRPLLEILESSTDRM